MNQLIDALFTHGYYVWDNFLTPDEVAELREHLPSEWNKARIGRSEEAIR
ncbi:MAG: SM-20 protein, partial [Vibrionaceae bacterium]|nr:SM-20 protein [Vibrionaceae bacterium]